MLTTKILVLKKYAAVADSTVLVILLPPPKDSRPATLMYTAPFHWYTVGLSALAQAHQVRAASAAAGVRRVACASAGGRAAVPPVQGRVLPQRCADGHVLVHQREGP